MSDGLILIDLFEILTGKNIPEIARTRALPEERRKMRPVVMETLSIGLGFMTRESGIDFGNCRPAGM